jgi:8-oxo-dGTP pyrophosphatase MutT (NUDIX family)
VYVDDAIVGEAEARWGTPREWEYRVNTSAEELSFIRKTQKKGRAHDVTLVIWDRSRARFAVIAKHAYAKGAYRPPSGGLEPGESLEAGAKREALEETGLDIELVRYVMRARVRFEGAGGGDGADDVASHDARSTDTIDAIQWTTHVFEAAARGGAPGDALLPRDTHEIREARWATREELLGPLRELLLLRDSAGIRYRVALHEAVFEAIES